LNSAARSQLWLATLTAVVALSAAVVPATIQLFDDEPPADAAAPAATAPAPVAPAPPTTVTQPSTGSAEGGGKGRRRGGG
jgi:hypothetical protein